MTFERDDDGLVIVRLKGVEDGKLVYTRDVVVPVGVPELLDGETVGDWLQRHGRSPKDEYARVLFEALKLPPWPGGPVT